MGLELTAKQRPDGNDQMLLPPTVVIPRFVAVECGRKSGHLLFVFSSLLTPSVHREMRRVSGAGH